MIKKINVPSTRMIRPVTWVFILLCWDIKRRCEYKRLYKP